MGTAASGESRRLEYYAQFLDDERLSSEERAQIARHLNFLLGVSATDPEEARQHFLPFVRQVWEQRIEVNVFDGLTVSLVFPIHPTTPSGLSNIDPVGRSIAGSSKTIRIHERFRRCKTKAMREFHHVNRC